MGLDWSNLNLIDLVKKAYTGEVMLPDFQRNFVWKRSDIEELLVSLLENMFIGTFLLYRVSPDNIPFNVIPIEGAKEVNPNYPQQPRVNTLILDGQQRLTSLFYALYSPDIPLKNTSLPYAFFINLEKLKYGNVEESIFSWSKEWREYKNLLIQNDGKFNIEKLKEKRILPLIILNNSSEFWRLWYRNFSTLFTNEENEKIEKYLRNLLEYSAYSLTIPMTERPENIVILFERINRTGIKLSVFDLLTARLHKFLNLRQEWENLFRDSYLIRELASNDIKNTKIPHYIIQGIVLSKDKSIKTKDLIKIDNSILNKEIWDKATIHLKERILNRLFNISEYGIPSSKWLSYPSMISIWISIFFKKDNGELEFNIDKINKWHWSAIFTERYSGSTETKLIKDFKDLCEWLNDDNKIPEVVLEARKSLDNLDLSKIKYSGSSIYKGVFNLIFRNNARDFFENDNINYSINDLEDHHIFPKGYFKKKNIELEDLEEINSVLNRTLISSSTNGRINRKAPAQYLDEMIRKYGDEESVKSLLKKHFIDEEMFNLMKQATDDIEPPKLREIFKRFIDKREELIKKKIESLIG